MPNIKGGPELALGSLLSSLKTPTLYAVHSQVTQGSQLEGYHFPGIKTCYYATLEMTLEMTGDLWSWTWSNFQDVTTVVYIMQYFYFEKILSVDLALV